MQKYAEAVYNIGKNELDDLVSRLEIRGFNISKQEVTRQAVHHQVSTKPVGYFDRHFNGSHFFVLSPKHLGIENNPLVEFMENYKPR